MESPQQVGSWECVIKGGILLFIGSIPFYKNTEEINSQQTVQGCLPSVVFLLEMPPGSMSKQKLWQLTGAVYHFENSSFTGGVSYCFIVWHSQLSWQSQVTKYCHPTANPEQLLSIFLPGHGNVTEPVQRSGRSRKQGLQWLQTALLY